MVSIHQVVKDQYLVYTEQQCFLNSVISMKNFDDLSSLLMKLGIVINY